MVPRAGPPSPSQPRVARPLTPSRLGCLAGPPALLAAALEPGRRPGDTGLPVPPETPAASESARAAAALAPRPSCGRGPLLVACRA